MIDLTDIPEFLRRTPKEHKLPEPQQVNGPMAPTRAGCQGGGWSGAETVPETVEASDVG